ncbi:MAG: L-seryl-tRNA(Sec) selenium transferase [Planctomycetes bacterium]|nr:L-seryl-tRNA(Sec) selenium transferase [Planctomycetota bacterium]
MPSAKDVLRKIPAVDRLLEALEAAGEATAAPRALVVDAVRSAVEAARDRLRADPDAEASEDALRDAILADARARLHGLARPYFRKVINATGIILHTALGRAVLARQAVDQIARELSGYSLLQADPETGRRSRRDQRIEDLLRRLTGAEAATVVNNNAAATMIVLNTVAAGREVIVSRGQLVEIGGSFRLPEMMAASGARMVEVGTTNKTHPRDYENAVTGETAAILRVHPSNYKIYGFTSEVPLETLREIADRHGLALIDDLGAGPLIDLSKYGFPKEPTLAESVQAGADLATSSADKLIGASQGGIILGRKKWVDAVRKSPLARVLRVGKLTLAALEATLALFLDEPTALREVPTNRMLLRDLASLDAQATRLAEALRGRAGDAADVEVVDGFSQLGSGSLPTHDIPTRVAAVAPRAMTVDDLARRLRLGEPPVFARIQNDRVLLDPRTLQDGEEDVLIEAVVRALAPEAT